MHPHDHAYRQWLRIAVPTWIVVAVLHVLTLFIPLSPVAHSDNMFEAIIKSPGGVWGILSNSISHRSSPKWMPMLEFGAIVGAEVLIFLGGLASLISFHSHWTVATIVAAGWITFTVQLLMQFGYLGNRPWHELLLFYLDWWGWGFCAWYITLLLAAIAAVGLERQRHIELHRAAGSDSGEQHQDSI